MLRKLEFWWYYYFSDMKSKFTILLRSFLACIIFALISCSSEDDEITYKESLTSVKSLEVPDTVDLNRFFDINFVVFGSNGCSEYSRFSTTNVGDTVFFQVYQRVKNDPGTACTQAIVEYPAAINFRIGAFGWQYFKFNDYESAINQETILDSIYVQ